MVQKISVHTLTSHLFGSQFDHMCTYTATRIRLAACGGAADGLYAVGASVKSMSSSEKKKTKKKQLTQSHTSLPAPNGAELPSCLTYSKCLVHMPLNIRPYLSQFNRCVQFETFFFLQLQILEVSFVFDHMVRPPLESLRRGTPENVYLCCSC